MALCLLASGCLASKPPESAPGFAPATPEGLLAQEQAAAFAANRTEVSRIHIVETESFHRSSVTGIGMSIDYSGCENPPARAYDLAFAGTHPAFDEFARPVPAHVFRTTERVCRIQFEFKPDGIIGKGYLEERPFESFYDRSDARYMGLADLRAESRGFSAPSSRDPFGGLQSSLFLIPHWLQGNLSRETLVSSFGDTKVYQSFQPYAGAQPVAGDCAMWELTGRLDPAPEKKEGKGKEPDPAKVGHTLLCMPRGSDVPLWVWSGSQADGNRTLLRTSEPMLLPRLEGTSLPPVQYEPAQWSRVASPLPGGAGGDMLVPPITSDDDWASGIARRVQALYLNPSFLRYRAASGLPYTQMSWERTNLDGYVETPMVPLHIPVPGPGMAFDRTTWTILSDGNATHWHDIYTRSASDGQSEQNLASLQGNDLDAFEPFPASKLPRLVPDAAARAQLAPLLPKKADWALFDVIPIAMPDGYPQWTFWTVMQMCTATEPGLYVSFNAAEGYMQGVSAMHGDADSCSTGDSAGSCVVVPRVLEPRIDPCLRARLPPGLAQSP